MDKKKLKAMLLHGLADLLADHGFKKRISAQSFYKKTDDGKVSIHLAFINHIDDFDVTVDFAIRLNDVEDILNEIDHPMTPPKKLDTYTLGAELGNVTGEGQKRWTIENEEDVKIAMRGIYLEILSVFFPVIEKYTTKESVYELAVKDDEEADIFWGSTYDRARCAIVLAEILQKDTDIRMELIRKNEEHLKNIEDLNLEGFIEFTERFKG